MWISNILLFKIAKIAVETNNEDAQTKHIL